MRHLVHIAFVWLSASASVVAADSVQVVKDLDYVDGTEYAEGKDRLDLYLPEGKERFPVVVFFHGGGLLGGDKSGSEHVGMALASEGYGAAIANYRLSPTVAHPEHAEDAARAIAWVQKNIESYGGNPRKIFLSGHSAGGYLAALLALDSSYLEKEGIPPGVIAGSIPIAGFFDVVLVAPDRPKDVWGEDESVWRQASATEYVRRDAPPMLFLYADGDDPWRRLQNEDIAAALGKVGHYDAEAVQISERDHTGIARSIAPGDATLVKMIAFMDFR